MTDAELREKMRVLEAFENTTIPIAVLALLDRLDAVRAVCDRADEMPDWLIGPDYRRSFVPAIRRALDGKP